jgi:diadenosine tetraphosphate (Ap4A) HIT family hydrolase
MADEYSKFIIKEYQYWIVYIAQNQSYLGRCVVWCKREDVLDLTEATLEEQKELFVILNDLKNTITKIFQPDWFNYAFLGNDTRHLHGHFIPRYKNSKEFMGIVFKDERWGHNYKTDYNFKIPPEVLDAIQAKIKELI